MATAPGRGRRPRRRNSWNAKPAGWRAGSSSPGRAPGTLTGANPRGRGSRATQPWRSRALGAQGLAPEARDRAPWAGRGRGSLWSWAPPAGDWPRPPSIRERPRLRIPLGAARPPRELRPRSLAPIGGAIRRSRPLDGHAPSAAAAASRLRLLPLGSRLRRRRHRRRCQPGPSQRPPRRSPVAARAAACGPAMSGSAAAAVTAAAASAAAAAAHFQPQSSSPRPGPAELGPPRRPRPQPPPPRPEPAAADRLSPPGHGPLRAGAQGGGACGRAPGAGTGSWSWPGGEGRGSALGAGAPKACGPAVRRRGGGGALSGSALSGPGAPVSPAPLLRRATHKAFSHPVGGLLPRGG